MAVTRDTIQLNVEIITPESRSLAQANKRLASIPNSIRKAIREGEGLERQMKEIASAGKLVEGIDLTKVAPAQVATRAKQLGAILKQIPSSAPGVAKLRAEYKALNDRLADIRQESRGVASAFRGRGSGGGFLGALRSGQALLIGVVAGVTSLVASFQRLVRATSLTQKFGASLENNLGSRSAAQRAIKEITSLADELRLPADDLVGSYTKLVNRGLRPTREEMVRLVDLARNQNKSLDQLAEAVLDAQTGEFERLKEFGIRAKSAGDQVTLSFRGQEVQVQKTDEAITQAIVNFGALDGVQGSAAASTDNLGGKFERFTSLIDRLLANLGRGGLGDAIGDLVDNASRLVEIFIGVTDVTEKASTNLRDLQTQFNLEIKTLREANLTQEARAELIERINSKYGDYLPNLLDEESTLGDIARAQELANRAFTQRIILLAAEERLQEVANQRLEAKREELQLQLDLTAAQERTNDAQERAFQGTGSSQNFAGLSTARGISGQAVANSIAEQAQERLNKNLERQNELQKEFNEELKVAEQLGVDVNAALNGDPLGGGGSGGSGGGGTGKSALERRLEALAAGLRDAEVELETSFVRQEITESEFNRRMLELQEENYQQQLAAFARFNATKTIAAKEAQLELLKVQAQLNPNIPGAVQQVLGRDGEANVGNILAGGLPTQDGVARSDVQEGVSRAQGIARRRQNALQNDRNADRVGDDQFELRQLEIQRELLNQEIELLREGNDAEVRLAAEKAEQLKEIDQDLFDKRKELAEREKAFQEELAQTRLQVAEDGLGVITDFLGRDEEARKKNAKAIKAFETARIIIAGQAELAEIAKNAAALGPAGIGVGIARSAVAIARTVAAIAKVQTARFARGGTPKFGEFGGRSHAQGGTRGYFDDGTQIEVEKGETFAIVNKNARGLLGFLSGVNEATGGVPFFNRGGIALDSPNTTPIVPPTTVSATAAPAADNREMINELRALAAAVNDPQRLRVYLPYSDLETAAEDLNTVRAAAEI
jgi:hypothetical protein